MLLSLVHPGSTLRILLKYHRSFLYPSVRTYPSHGTLPAQVANGQAFALAAGSRRPLPLARGSLCDGGAEAGETPVRREG